MDIGILSMEVDRSVPSAAEDYVFLWLVPKIQRVNPLTVRIRPIFGYSQATALFPELYKQSSHI